MAVIFSERWDSGSIPPDWAGDAGYSIDEDQWISSPAALKAQTGGVAANLFYQPDTAGLRDIAGEVSILAAGPVDTAFGSAAVVLRSSTNLAAQWATASAYRGPVTIGASPAILVGIYKRSAGVDTILASMPSAGILESGRWYRSILRVVGESPVSLQLSIQRRDDTTWLNPSGLWQLDRTHCLEATDSTPDAALQADGYHGIRTSVPAGNTIWLDNYQLDDLAAAVLPATLARPIYLALTASLNLDALEGRITPGDTLPERELAPALVYHLRKEMRDRTLSGPSPIVRADWRVVAYSDDPDEADALALAAGRILEALEDTHPAEGPPYVGAASIRNVEAWTEDLDDGSGAERHACAVDVRFRYHDPIT